MTLRLAQPLQLRTCPECKGAGRVPCPKTFSVRTSNWNMGYYVPTRQPGEGHPIPCPLCKGKKVVTEDQCNEPF